MKTEKLFRNSLRASKLLALAIKLAASKPNHADQKRVAPASMQ